MQQDSIIQGEISVNQLSIITDSCCDVTETLRTDLHGIAPLTITIDGKEYVDDGSVAMVPYLAAMKASPNPARSACPSPACYAETILSAPGCPGDSVRYHTPSSGRTSRAWETRFWTIPLRRGQRARAGGEAQRRPHPDRSQEKHKAR